ncbi:MAG: DUF4105 domain-containing protein [Proteobacteria bacterium]|nr:DUF4105 domain-containing protein [Pseudomonadota bacterium]
MTAPIGISWADPLNVSSVQLKLLSEDAQWRALLHYDQLVSRISPNSRAAESDFFLSEAGKTDPRAELEATLRAMLSAEPLDDTHAICRFPARFLWLSKKSELTSLLFPKPACQRFRQWYDAISAQGITLIFPASFVNNPASAFGHTFLRLDHGSADDDTRLLDYAADFAAATHGENALLYAIKGIFGGFDGFFSVGPFYKKVEKYSDLENRDIWEYHLNLNRDEVSMLTFHLWELREKPFSYFYFDENCSYHILALLDVARPSLGLIQSMRLWVIPIDTIREIQVHPGLVDKVVFRASAATKLHGRIDQTASSAQTLALKAADSSQDLDKSIEENSGSPENLASALDLGYDFLTYQRIRTRSDSVEEKQRAWKLLAARSSLPPAKALEYPVPVVRAENGHKTAMLSLGVGRSEDLGISEFVFRPAFHSLSDPLGGYLPGNQIKFFETVARYTEGRGVELNRFTALDIMALTPRDRFFQPVSWRVNLSYQQYQREKADPLGLGSLSAGGGRSYKLAEPILAYGLIEGAFEYSDMLNHSNALGVGPRLGLIYTPADRYATEISFSQRNFLTGDTHSEQLGSVSQRVNIIENTVLRFDVNYTDAFQNSYWSSMIRLERFFTP